jgi:transposase
MSGHRSTAIARQRRLASPLFIPAGSPELNAAEKIWQYLRQTYLSNRLRHV